MFWTIPPLADATAHATIVLAIVTGVLAASTVVLAVITHLGSRRVQAASAKQLKASYRPVIVPFQQAEHVRFRGGSILASTGPHIEENQPDLPRYSAAFLPVENVGNGPALNVQGTFQGPRGNGETRFSVEAIAAGGRGVIGFENWAGDSLGYTGNDKSVSAVVEYDDLAGETYRTNVTFDIGNNAYKSSPQ